MLPYSSSLCWRSSLEACHPLFSLALLHFNHSYLKTTYISHVCVIFKAVSVSFFCLLRMFWVFFPCLFKYLIMFDWMQDIFSLIAGTELNGINSWKWACCFFCRSIRTEIWVSLIISWTRFGFCCYSCKVQGTSGVNLI